MSLPDVSSASHDFVHLESRRCEKSEIGRANKKRGKHTHYYLSKEMLFCFSLNISLQKRENMKEAHSPLPWHEQNLGGWENWMELLCLSITTQNFCI